MSLRKESILLSISNVFQVLTSLLFSIFVARLIINKADFGRYQQLFVLINFLAVIASSIPNALSFFFGKYVNTDQHKGAFKRFFIFLSLTSISLVILFLALNKWLALRLDNSFMTNYVLVIAGIALVRLLFVYFSNFCLLTHNLYYYIWNNVFYLIFCICLLVIAFFLKFNIKEILLGQLLVDSIRLIFLLPKVAPFLKLKNNVFLKKEEFSYLYPLCLVAVISNLYLIVDRIMISSMLGPGDFADYQVGAFVFPFIGIITGSVVTALLPRISKNYHEGDFKQIVDNLQRATEKVTFLLVPIFVYCLVFGQELITWLYSDKFAFSGYIFQIYTLRFFGTVVLFSMMMNAIGLQMWVFINTTINLVINFILNYFFILKWGVMGAVYAGILSTYLGYILPVTIMNRRLKVSLLDYFPIKSYLKTILISLVIAVSFKLIYNHYAFVKIWSIFISIIYYFIVVYLLDRKLFSNDSLKKILKRDGS
ncbi:Peptidoglycan biosynthesis protein MviN/MurJ, putative lipid II flippase [Chitinophaga ginsengisegetis]|uniref:Peptidoglycan biosynthesis protein MviN/MurJ, putative lipid II flippase n=1 Tax=Chitinophaga ginsengisegetis TaxID=393003 RepID=A0A1T5P6L4_9BACT|nr:lipid II flippase MurJ [Chitinophaga ginsengisegetis]SKD07909.1 Peptidoglycan biosynthesis protein MviN/MurJ, putative lipid II flippase [Chitinophaga ginsengisegetis]